MLGINLLAKVKGEGAKDIVNSPSERHRVTNNSALALSRSATKLTVFLEKDPGELASPARIETTSLACRHRKRSCTYRRNSQSNHLRRLLLGHQDPDLGWLSYLYSPCLVASRFLLNKSLRCPPLDCVDLNLALGQSHCRIGLACAIRRICFGSHRIPTAFEIFSIKTVAGFVSPPTLTSEGPGIVRRKLPSLEFPYWESSGSEDIPNGIVTS